MHLRSDPKRRWRWDPGFGVAAAGFVAALMAGCSGGCQEAPSIVDEEPSVVLAPNTINLVETITITPPNRWRADDHGPIEVVVPLAWTGEGQRIISRTIEANPFGRFERSTDGLVGYWRTVVEDPTNWSAVVRYQLQPYDNWRAIAAHKAAHADRDAERQALAPYLDMQFPKIAEMDQLRGNLKVACQEPPDANMISEIVNGFVSEKPQAGKCGVGLHRSACSGYPVLFAWAAHINGNMTRTVIGITLPKDGDGALGEGASELVPTCWAEVHHEDYEKGWLAYQRDSDSDPRPGVLRLVEGGIHQLWVDGPIVEDFERPLGFINGELWDYVRSTWAVEPSHSGVPYED